MLDIFGQGFLGDIGNFISGIPQSISRGAQDIGSAITGFVDGGLAGIDAFIKSVPGNISNAVDFITEQNNKVTKQIGQNIANVASGAGQGLSSVGKGSGELIGGVFNTNPLLIPGIIAVAAVVGIIALRI